MDEFVKVSFPTRRTVWVDDEPTALTNKVFQVETGFHTFHLGPKQNYKPAQRRRLVKDTLPTEPMVVDFERTDVAPEAPEEE